MNAHPEFTMAQPRVSTGAQKLSQAELAQFLNRLAALYRDPQTGNPRLSAALHELASQLVSSKRPAKPVGRSKASGSPPKQVAFQWLRGLDTEAVRKFISDTKKTKSQLIELASERFSIPRSKLIKMNTQGVREEILGALLHEESLRIISQEAERGGANRSS